MNIRIPRHKSITIRGRMIWIVIGNLLLFAFMTFSLILWFQNVLEDKIRSSARQTLQNVTGNIDVYIKNKIRLADSIAIQPDLLQLLQQTGEFGSSKTVWPLVELLRELKNYSVVNDYIYSIGIYNYASHKMLTTADGIYSIPDSEQPAWADYALKMQSASFASADLRYAVPAFSGAVPAFAGTPTFSVVRRLQGSQDNILLINTSKAILSELVGDIALWEGTGLTIRTGEGMRFFSAGNAVLAASTLSDVLGEPEGTVETVGSASQYRTVQIDGQAFLVVSQTSELTGWKLDMFIPQKEIMHDVFVMKRILYVALFVLAAVTTLFFALLYMQILTPIRRLITSIQKLERGSPFTPVAIERMDELGYLQQRFNQLVMREQQMQREIYEEQLHKKEIELKFLQSQVNPHFLYNTLDSLYWLAEERGVEEISEVILDLSQFFRLSLSRGRDTISVREMIEHLQCYLRIQQFRHTDKFEVSWHVDRELLNVKVMKLMLQPIVENAIIHGLEEEAEKGQLHIAVERFGSRLVCRVRNTGGGMSRDQLDKLMQAIQEAGGEGVHTYGLKNVFQRLRILYGEDMSFRIESEPHGGTTVTMMIELGRLEGGNVDHERHTG